MLTYEQLTADPLYALLSFFRYIQVGIDLDRLSDGIARSVGQRAREIRPFAPSDVLSHRYAKFPVLANFEDLVIRSSPGYYPIRYFAPTDSDNSLIGMIFNARQAIESSRYDEAVSLADRALAQDPGDPELLKLRESAYGLTGTAAKPGGNTAMRNLVYHARRSAVAPTGIIRTSEVEVVMLTYNEEDMLPYSLPPLKRHFDQFLILDMKSTDRTREIIAGVLGSCARILPFEREELLKRGYAHARNFAAEHAERPWLFVVDADEVLSDGLVSGMIGVGAVADDTNIVTLRLRNFKPNGWKPGESFCPNQLQVGKTEDGKKRIYSPTKGAIWKGYLHEELYDQFERPNNIAESTVLLDHLTVFRSKDRQEEKRRMYSWMLLRLYREPDLREGVNQFWYEEHIPRHLAQIEADARAFLEGKGVSEPQSLGEMRADASMVSVQDVTV